MGPPDTFPWVWPFVGHGFGALSGAIGAVGWMVYSITRSVRIFNSQRPAPLRIDAAALQREYLTYGKARFEERWKEEKDTHRRGRAARRRASPPSAAALISILSGVPL
jgi:hypothetical protein